MGGANSPESPQRRPRETRDPSREHLREEVNVSTPEQAKLRIRALIAERQRVVTGGEMTSRRLRENSVYQKILERLDTYIDEASDYIPSQDEPLVLRRAYYQSMIMTLVGSFQNRYFEEAPVANELPGMNPMVLTESEVERIFTDLFGGPGGRMEFSYQNWKQAHGREARRDAVALEREVAFRQTYPNLPDSENPFVAEREASRLPPMPPAEEPVIRTSSAAPRPSGRPSESREALLSNDPIDPRQKIYVADRLRQIVQREWRQGNDWDPQVRMQVQWFVDLLPTAGYYHGLVNNLTEREAGQYVSVIIRKLQDEATSDSILEELRRTWENMSRDLPNPHAERNNPNLQNGIDLLQADNLRHILGTLREEFIDNVVDDENDANEHFDALVLPEYERMLANMVASSTAEQGLRVGHDRVITNYHLNQAGQNRTFNTGITNSAQRRIREMKARVRREGRRNHTDQDDIDERIQERTTEIQAETRGMLEVASSPRGRLALYYYNYLVNLYGPTVGGGEEGNAFRQRAANFRLTAIRDWSQRLSQIRFNRDGWVQGWNR